MRIFIFKSETRKELRAFTGDLMGASLPERFGPWRAIGAASAAAGLPHNLPRPAIEEAIKAQGFQLWRFKDKTKAA